MVSGANGPRTPGRTHVVSRPVLTQYTIMMSMSLSVLEGTAVRRGHAIAIGLGGLTA